LRSGSAGDFR